MYLVELPSKILIILPLQNLAQSQEMPFLEQPELAQTLSQELENIQPLNSLQTEEIHGKRLLFSLLNPPSVSMILKL